ncbi:MAG: hypothetical protein R2731_00845 [Nocardioides sp.]
MTSAAEIAGQLIASFRDQATDPTPPPPTRRLPPLAAPVPIAPSPTVQRADLLTTLKRRRSLRFFDGGSLAVGELLDCVAAGQELDRAGWAADDGALLEVTALCARVEGLEPGIFRLDPARREAALVAPLPSAELLGELTLQAEFGQAAAILSFGGDLEAASRAGGRGYRELMCRAGATAYAVWLDAVSRGWVGSVFAGFIPAAVRRRLASDGVSRHQLFALALGTAPTEPPLSTGGGSTLTRREEEQA